MFPTSISTSTTAILTSLLIGDPSTNTNSDDEGLTIDYLDIPRLQKALEAKEHLWLFFIAADKLWRKDLHGRHKIVAAPSSWITILTAAHDNVAHKGFYAMTTLIAEHFWGPHMWQDISWFVRTCHLCQICQTRNVLIPPTVATPVPLFVKMYMDTMHMPTASGFKYLVQGHCPETLVEIVSDNGPAFVKALDQLAKKYHALFKAVDGDQAKWNCAAHFVFWADCITVRRRMGCSPYFAVTGTHPLLPLDIAKATYLLPLPTTTLSTTDLIARHAIALQKHRSDLAHLRSLVVGTQVPAAIQFEQQHLATLCDFNFYQGLLVLMRNTAIEKALNQKMHPQYLGPLLVISRNRGGAYILAKLDGSVFDRPVAAFRIIPYFACRSLKLADLEALLDISQEHL
ncbi:hypothetical protein HETIRDRAFT_455119 [Heterobasidion irregulare TC 32-1]|uniref:Integrase zinc-binding domain-containing protein n=1 Tax=Heterobasidion irregulare (strain TC 32-1) TaxID=747525 RepID=W4JT09_HETIT|nr:uncharacterized protein HETIRDRAFT_455119 [Heterobasidion irregulare TC 32-1]ETW76594.1 hypothetical protein HETIRDRAFT_455119 [Heterobasidion irregulare TC 32-1]